MELPKLEPMSVGQIFTRSIRYYLSHFWWFLGMAIVIYAPLTVVRLIFKLYESTETISNLGSQKFLVFDIPQGLVVGLLGSFVSFSLNIALFRNISQHYLDNRVAFWETYKLTWSKFKIVLTASVLFTIFFYVPRTLSTLPEKLGADPTGFLGTVFSGAFLAVLAIVMLVMIWFAVTPQCIAATNLSAWQSMKQSKALVKGNMWRVIGLFASLMVVVIGIFWITWPVDLLLVHLWQSVFTESNIVVSFRPTMIGILFSPLYGAAYSLLYYDLRARKEGLEAETTEGLAGELNQGEGQIQLKKPRISRLAIASIVLGLSGLVAALGESWGILGLILRDVLMYFTFWGIPGLILGISAIIAIRSKKGLLKGRVLALAGIGISCLAIYLSYGQIIKFVYTPKAQPCSATVVLLDAELAGLPSSATSVQAAGWVLFDEGEQYLMFQATAEDIEKFVAESEGIIDKEPEVFDSDNMYLPRKYRSKFKDKKEWEEYSSHEQFYRGRSWPDWYDPTIRVKGRKYECSGFADGNLEDWMESNDEMPKDFRWGTLVINDETNTVHIRVRWHSGL